MVAGGAALPMSAPGRGQFPAEQAALKCLNLVTGSLDRRGAAKPAGRCAEAALNAFAITFEGRIVPSATN